jgi:hypothetical protein
MAVTKRTRYEVLKRDNHTCRYCGATAPDATLTVDHVTPVALGGSDDPSNLVTACRDCNYGKASTSPEAAVVEDVKQIDMRWAGAIRRVAATRAKQARKRDKYAVEFLNAWQSWTNGYGESSELDSNWETTIRRFYDLGVSIEDIKHCVDVAGGNKKVSRYDTYRYFCGCVWRVVTEMQDAAKALLEVEEIDGGA